MQVVRGSSHRRSTEELTEEMFMLPRNQKDLIMNAACFECIRLYRESDDALAVYTKLLERIYGVDADYKTLLVTLELDVEQAQYLLGSKTRAFEDHQVTHNTRRLKRRTQSAAGIG